MSVSAIFRVNLASLMAQIVQVGGFPVVLAFSLDALELNEAIIGLVLTLPWLTVLLGAGFLPRLIHQTDERWAAVLGVAVSGIGLGILLWSASLIGLILSAFLMGMGLVLRWVACDTWIVQLASPGTRGRAIGLHETLMGFGIAIGPAVLLLKDLLIFEPAIIFLVLLVLSLLVFVVTPPGEPDTEESPTSVPNPGRTLYLLLLMSLFAATLSGFAETSSVALLPLWFVDNGLTEPSALGLLISFGLGGTVLQLPIGSIADRWGHAVAERLCGLFLILGCLANLFLLEAPVGVLHVYVFIWGGAIGGLNTLAVIDAGARTSGGDTSRAMAAIASAYTLGGVIGPAFLGGVWGAFDADAMMTSLAFIGLLYFILHWLRKP